MATGNAAFHIIELQATSWNVPLYYHDLLPVGAGRFGQVWYDCFISIDVTHLMMCFLAVWSPTIEI